MLTVYIRIVPHVYMSASDAQIIIILLIIFNTDKNNQARFTGEWPGWSPQGLHKTEIESTDFIQWTASLKSWKDGVFLVIIRNKNKKTKIIVIN
jgi:hypothetical protein